MPLSILTSPGIAYPDRQGWFSPAEPFPEYQLGHLSATPNPVYRMVRTLFAQLELDKEHLGTAAWNPLRSFVSEGSSVFLLCNFVYHRRPQESEQGLQAKCIHGSVLRALVDYLLLAVGPRGRVTFGNAPLQSCDWKRVLGDTGAERVAEFYAERGMPVRARDLRLFVAPRDAFGRVKAVERRDDSDAAVEVDLGERSLLAELTAREPKSAPFRVTDYNPRRIEAFHDGGHHRYAVHRDVLDADVIVSLPKLKTHEKVGITCALKGFVGAIGHKDCLAHHRFGAPGRGGDEYPPSMAFLRPISSFHDWVYSRSEAGPLQGWAQFVDRTLRRIASRAGAIMSGAWHGNDTAWRMSLDLARILHYADASGRLQDAPQRRHLALIDGIVAGEGNGPLDPQPAAAGTLIFGDDVSVVDRVACRLMGFSPMLIPLVREAFRLKPWPITAHGEDEATECQFNGTRCLETELAPVLGRAFHPPAGWRSYLRSA
jgi:uncharacterized protein (DUF362 family)